MDRIHDIYVKKKFEWIFMVREGDSRKEVIKEAQENERKVHFATLIDI